MLTEDAFVDFKCPHCGQPASFPQDLAGTLQTCPNCNEGLIVPGAGGDQESRVPLPVETKRLLLRRLTARDWRDLLEIVSDEENNDPVLVPANSEETVLRWLESDPHVRITTQNVTFWLGIESREHDRLIGLVGINFIDDHRQALLQYVVVVRPFQRRGYALEALDAVLGFCFEDLNIHRVTARSDSRDERSVKLLERLGMRKEGEFVKSRWAYDQWADVVWFAALREEYTDSAGDPATES